MRQWHCFWRQCQPFPKNAARHEVSLHTAQIGGQIAGPYQVALSALRSRWAKNTIHVCSSTVSKSGGRKLKKFGLGDNLVDAVSSFFADSEAAHQRCQRLVAGFWRRIHEAVGRNQRHVGIGNFHPAPEKFYHRPRASNKKVQMNECACHLLTDGKSWIHGDGFAQGLLDDFIARH